MASKTIFDLSQKYIKQAGDTTKDWYQIRSLLIISLQYSMIGALMVILPFLEQDPVFLCKVLDPTTGAPTGKFKVCQSVTDACKENPVMIDPVASLPSITKEFELYCDNA
jgi:hypothetical protein